MTTKQSKARLSLYVAIAMFTAANAGIGTVDFANAKEMISFCLSVLVTGMITARSYIDQTPSMVEPQKNQP